MIKDIKLLIQADNGNIVEVELEQQRVRAVIKLLGLELDNGGGVAMARRQWKRENKNLQLKKNRRGSKK